MFTAIHEDIYSHLFTKFKADEFDVLICVAVLSLHSYIKEIKLTTTKFWTLQ